MKYGLNTVFTNSILLYNYTRTHINNSLFLSEIPKGDSDRK